MILFDSNAKCVVYNCLKTCAIVLEVSAAAYKDMRGSKSRAGKFRK